MQYCTFYINREMFGVDVLLVQEVVRSQQITPVPLAPAVIRGLMNLRGNIVSTIDMRRRLNLPPAPAGSDWINVIVRTSSGLISLLVDQIGDVIEVDEAGFEPVPATARGDGRASIARVYKLDGALLQVLHPDRVVEFHGGSIDNRAA